MEGHVYLDDLDCLAGRLTATTRRVMDRALEESRRREHALLTTAHVWFAVANTEWDLFASTLRGVEVNPRDALRAIEEHLRLVPSQGGSKLRVSPPMKLVCKLALHHAARAGRSTVEAADLLIALFDETHGVPVAILRRFGVAPDVVASRVEAHFRERELRQERLKKRFDLPPHIDQFTTNLNRLACLDKLPPVFGREREIQQVLEILSHRERSNSVMLVGEPGVGKTAIAEGLARLIEFEPDTIPVRLRDAQILGLQMNVLVSGTMLRGMFEERLHH